jgi:hypothetical protein
MRKISGAQVTTPSGSQEITDEGETLATLVMMERAVQSPVLRFYSPKKTIPIR